MDGTTNQVRMLNLLRNVMEHIGQLCYDLIL